MQSYLTSLSLSVFDATSKGVKYQNDDHLCFCVPEPELLSIKGASFVIADGVGSASKGKEAAVVASESFVAEYYSAPIEWGVYKSAEVVIDGINKWLFEQGQLNGLPQATGYLSTMSAMILVNATAHLFHIGDSRIYRWRSGKLLLLTRDHTTQLKSGASFLTKAMGLRMATEVDYSTVDFRIGDVFILSTDGLHQYVSEQLLCDAAEAVSIKEAGQALIQRALDKGSKDNLSVILVRVNNV